MHTEEIVEGSGWPSTQSTLHGSLSRRRKIESELKGITVVVGSGSRTIEGTRIPKGVAKDGALGWSCQS